MLPENYLFGKLFLLPRCHFSPVGGRGTHAAFESSRQVALVGEAAFDRHRRQRHAEADQGLRVGDTDRVEIDVGRNVIRGAEGAGQVRAGQARHRRQVGHRDIALEVGADIVSYPVHTRDSRATRRRDYRLRPLAITRQQSAQERAHQRLASQRFGGRRH